MEVELSQAQVAAVVDNMVKPKRLRDGDIEAEQHDPNVLLEVLRATSNRAVVEVNMETGNPYRD